MTLPAIAHAVSPYRQLLVGFSGGTDSTVLLHRLKLWRDREPDVQLRAMHIHHGLSPHADDWVAHCEAVCSGWEIPLIVERVTLEDEGWVLRRRRGKPATPRFLAHYSLEKRWSPRSIWTTSARRFTGAQAGQRACGFIRHA